MYTPEYLGCKREITYLDVYNLVVKKNIYDAGYVARKACCWPSMNMNDAGKCNACFLDCMALLTSLPSITSTKNCLGVIYKIHNSVVQDTFFYFYILNLVKIN